MYDLLRRILFLMPPEAAHSVSLRCLNIATSIPLSRLIAPPHSVTAEEKPTRLLGLEFPNKVGLAAGLDKNGDYFNGLAAVGFGFLEIGTVTPRAQSGNPKPRLFRLPESEAIINRMGFNNKGVDHLVARARQRDFEGILGVNIGKNLSTPVEHALDDYLFALRAVYSVADYITVNISSPNTPGLRSLQHGDALRRLISGLREEQVGLERSMLRTVPMFLKVAPDLTDEELIETAAIFKEEGVEGVIATNTTSGRLGVELSPYSDEAGGLSGRPVFELSNRALEGFRSELPSEIPIIAAGGISSAEDARRKLDLGADLVQIYSGFIYQGPKLVHNCIAELG